MAARFGGDEFAVLVTDVHHAGAIEHIADRLLGVLAAPYDIDGRTIHSTASIGIVSSGTGAHGAAEIIQRADLAMYAAKSAGRGRTVPFAESMPQGSARPPAGAQALRQALRAGELQVLYQPIFDLQGGQAVCADAGVRWEDPAFDTLASDELLAFAEANGLMIPLGRFVLGEACARHQQWRQSDPARAPEAVSLPLTRTELLLGTPYLEHLRLTLADTGIDPGCLQLAVPEPVLTADPVAVVEMLESLRGVGVKIALDRFGAAGSSWASLRLFPFDSIRIDATLLGGLEAHREVLLVLEAMVRLIENLGVCSVAQGVDSASQIAALRMIRCRQALGPALSPAVTGDSFTAVRCISAGARTG
jgi:predicted signal transduction protein with EAL and GGDEF domain